MDVPYKLLPDDQEMISNVAELFINNHFCVLIIVLWFYTRRAWENESEFTCTCE